MKGAPGLGVYSAPFCSGGGRQLEFGADLVGVNLGDSRPWGSSEVRPCHHVCSSVLEEPWEPRWLCAGCRPIPACLVPGFTLFPKLNPPFCCYPAVFAGGAGGSLLNLRDHHLSVGPSHLPDPKDQETSKWGQAKGHQS